MATTTKTLAPTNQTITLPDMTERPNASVLVDGTSKEADAINALSEQMTIVVGLNLASNSAINNALTTLFNSVTDRTVRNIAWTCASGVTTPFVAANYAGIFARLTSNRARVMVMRSGYHEILTAHYDGTNWNWYRVDIEGVETIETPTTPTWTSVVNSSYNNRVTLKKCGRIVTIGGEFKAAEDISANATAIATGCPPSAQNATIGQFTAYCDGNPVQLCINNYGTLQTMYGGNIPSGTIVRFGYTYISAAT